MCGIVAAVTQRNIMNFLIDGIKKLEYRGYDSSGLAIIDHENNIIRIRSIGKTSELIKKINKKKIVGNIGVAHTRWATHGKISKTNTHPHVSSNIVVVHNGIIENNAVLRVFLQKKGYIFHSDTDTETIAHLLHWEQNKKKESLEKVIKNSIKKLHGNYSVVVIDKNNPSQLIAVRSKSPLVIGLGIEENFIASDQIALLHITNRFIYLEEGDIAIIKRKEINIFNKKNCKIKRKEILSNVKYKSVKKGKYSYYMEKEIYEQPTSIRNTLKNRLQENNTIYFSEFRKLQEKNLFYHAEHIQIVACGTSYHAAMVSRYWFESLANMPCDVEIASEFSSRKLAVRKKSFLITLSQSGETADTLSALRYSKKFGYVGNLTICNMEGSSLIKESDSYILTKAGIEIGVASTKSFTTQLTVLLMLVAQIANFKKENIIAKNIIQALNMLPNRIEEVLKKNKSIKNIAKQLSNKKNILFLGRGEQYPIAMEGALKLKEISYIHAEAYPAGELKHGPLALIDENTPVILIAPKNSLLEKIKKNIKEISLRGGIIYIFSDQEFDDEKNINIVKLPYVEELIAPIFYVIPLQLLSYYIALSNGKNIDQPRHLAKSVTVE